MIFSGKKAGIWLTILALWAASCQNSFQTDPETGIEYLFVEENPDAPQPKQGQGLALHLIYRTSDSVFYDGAMLIRLDKPKHKGSIEQALAMMHLGDSAHFRISADSFFLYTVKNPLPDVAPPGSKLDFRVRLREIKTAEEIRQEQKIAHQSRVQAELMQLDDYIERKQIEVQPTASGLYFILLKKGSGKPPQKGQTVVVHYTGEFLDGTVFSSTTAQQEPFEFEFGSNDVIDGWNQALARMRTGTRARLIMPSTLAYGKEGIQDVIPPYSTLIFTIEILEIKD